MKLQPAVLEEKTTIRVETIAMIQKLSARVREFDDMQHNRNNPTHFHSCVRIQPHLFLYPKTLHFRASTLCSSLTSQAA
jgi:hypothetical protein